MVEKAGKKAGMGLKGKGGLGGGVWEAWTSNLEELS
jgi:hypothetical protein